MRTYIACTAEEKKTGTANCLALILIVFIVLMPAVFAYAGEQENYVFSRKEDAICQTLLEHGYSLAGASGILGNISVENPSFEPDLYANGGATYGLFQWTDDGDRKNTLTRFCNNRLLYPNRVEGQLAYALYELEGGDPLAKRVNAYLKTADDPRMAAMEFAVGFERCIGATADSTADGVYTGGIYPEHVGQTYQALSRRMNNAAKYFAGYSSAGYTSAGYTAAGENAAQDDLELDVSGTPTAGIAAEKEDEMEEEVEQILPVTPVTSRKKLWMFRIMALVVGYFLGTIEGVTVIIRNVRDKKELRMDRKLPSLFEVLQYAGIKETFLSALIDIGKFYLALFIVYEMTKGGLDHEQILWTGLGVILGNDYPFWHRFRGGMGITVTTVFLCTYMPIWGYQCCLLGLLAAIFLRSLPVGAMCITLFAVPYAFLCKDVKAGFFILAALIILINRHSAILKKYVGRAILKNYYRKRHRHLHRREALADGNQ